MNETEKKPQKKNSELIRTLKYACFAISAGVIQLASTALFEKIGLSHYWSYLIGLILSVIWNFTFNRKFTFKSANNVPVAMLKVAVYYLIFTPLSTWWTKALDAATFWGALKTVEPLNLGMKGNELIVQAGTMIVNFITEFLYQRFFVFGKSIDTNSAAQKEKAKEEELTSVDKD